MSASKVVLLIFLSISVGASAAWAASATAPETRGGQSPATARATAERLSQSVPRPEGASIDGIRWEEAGGAFALPEIEFVVRYNLACQWYRAFADGRQVKQALSVIEEVPNWSGFAGTDVGAVARIVAEDARAGGFTARSAGVLETCRAAHGREVTYARGRGTSPGT